MLKQAKTNNRKTVFGKHKLFKQRHYQTVRDSSRGDEAWRIFKIIGWNINEEQKGDNLRASCVRMT